jgi:signal transduction histidine kinase
VSERLLRVVAIVVAVLDAAAAAAGLFLAIGVDPRLREVLGMCAAVAWAASGAWLAVARPRNWLGWLLLLIGTVSTWGPLCAYAGVTMVRSDPDSGFGLLVAWLGSFYWPVGTLLPVTVLLILYPTGRLPSQRWRPVLVTAFAGTALLCLALATSSGSLQDLVPDATLPFEVPAWLLVAILSVAAVLVVGSLLATLAGTAVRLHRAVAPQRQQLWWMAVPVVLWIVTAFAGDLLGQPTGDLVGTAVLAAVPVAVVVGVLWYHLLGIDVVVRRTLVYTLLTVAVAGFFATATGALSMWAPSGAAPTFVAAAVVAVGLAPARDLLQRLVDNLIYGRRRDPMAVVDMMGRHAVTGTDPQLLPGMLAALSEALRVPSITVIDTAERPVAAHGTPPVGGVAAHVPLRYAAGELGSLVVTTAPGDQLNADARRLVDAVAPMVAAAMRSASLAVELVEARGRAVAVAHAERDRLRRDLHDGLGPSLSGMSLGLEAAQTAFATDPDAAERVVGRLRDEMATAIAEIRRIIAGLRPGILDERGLADALRHRARAAAVAGHLDVAVTVPVEFPPLAAELEVAAYRIADEALTNAVRHAGATRVSVDVAVDTEVRIEVRDDGHGLPATPRDGVGLASMRRRARDLGGHLHIDSSPAGTRLLATLPKARP